MNMFRTSQIVFFTLCSCLGFSVFLNQSLNSYPTQEVENATYYLPDVGMISLVNGRYEGQNLSLILNKNVAFGDLNGDLIQDAVVFLKALERGTQTSTYLAVLIAQDDQLKNVDTLLLGESIRIKSAFIETEQLSLNFLAFSAKDLPCCPSQKRQQYYRFELASQTLMPVLLEAHDLNGVRLRLNSSSQSQQNEFLIEF